MLITLVTLIILALSGPEQVFMVKGLKKEIKQHVEDKDRKQEVLDIIKISRKKILKANKAEEDRNKKFYKTLKTYPCDFILIKEQLANHQKEEIALQEMMVDNRLKLQELLKPEEWNKIIEASVHPTSKAVRKKLKSDDKIISNVKKHFQEIKEILLKDIKDEEALASINERFTMFKESNLAMIESRLNNNYTSNELMRKQTCTRDLIESFYKEQNEHKKAVRKNFIDLVQVTQQNVDKKQWLQIRSKLKSIIIK